MLHPTARQLFSTLNHLYDACDSAGEVRDDMVCNGYGVSEAEQIQDKINTLMNDLDDILPGLQAQIDEK